MFFIEIYQQKENHPTIKYNENCDIHGTNADEIAHSSRQKTMHVCLSKHDKRE
jgi:hypothetical protein